MRSRTVFRRSRPWSGHASRSRNLTSPSASRPIRRVLLFVQSTQLGGMEAFCVDIGAEFVRRGLDVSVVLPESELVDPVAARFGAVGVDVIRLETDARRGRIEQLRRFWRLLQVFRTLAPDVVHLNTGGSTGGLAVVLGARFATRATVVVTEHDVPRPQPGRGEHLARYVLDAASHAVLAISRKTAAVRRERLPTLASRRKFGSIPIGIPLPDVPAATRASNRLRVRQELGIDQAATVIGSVVRLAPGKGLDDLINAFALVHRETPCKLVLVGDGPLRSELEALADRLGVRDAVHFAGYHTDPRPMLDAFDVFALAVLLGSGSIALLEAMSHGLASVITFRGPEEAVIAEETGLCAPPSCPDELARQLLRLASEPELRSHLGVAGEARVRRDFSIQRVADDLLEMYATTRSNGVPGRLRAD